MSKGQTVFFTSVDPMNKGHKDPEKVDLKAPRLARYLQTAWKKHQKTRCIGSISNLRKRKDLSSIRRDRTPSSFATHSQPTVSRRLSRWKLEQSYTRKKVRHPRPPLKSSFKDSWMKELGSEVAGGSEDSQQTQTQPKTTNPTVRTWRPVSTEQPSSSSAQAIDKRFLLGIKE